LLRTWLRLWQRSLGHLYKKSKKILAGGMASGIVFSDTDDEPYAASIKSE
jgi:hypothetical protein